MEDYPGTLAEFEERFTSEDACLEYLASLRWPGGFERKNTVPTLLVFDELLNRAPTRRLGSGCTNSEGLWLGQDESGFLGSSKWMRPTLVEEKLESEVEGQKGRLW